MFTLVDVDGQFRLVPRSHLHIPLEQIPGDDEMLNIVFGYQCDSG